MVLIGFGKRRRTLLGLAAVAVVLTLGGWMMWRWTKPHRPPTAKRPLAHATSNAPMSAARSTSAPSRVAARQANLPPSKGLGVTLSQPARAATNAPAAKVPTVKPEDAEAAARAAEKLFKAQLALARQGIYPGCLDGEMGSRTHAALRAFQKKEDLPATGELDAATASLLAPEDPLYAAYTVTSDDLARLQPVGRTWLAKSQQDRLDYETILELVSEKGQALPELIRRLNPQVNWDNVAPGTVVRIPSIELPPPAKAAFVKIFLSDRVLEAFDENNELLAHFPCSIARRAEQRPVGELQVTVVAHNPTYTFNPEVFPESAEAQELGRKLTIPPGPNNPVGTVWIGLDRPGYGIHGTPRPEWVGRAESHGCFRLANWNAEYLLQLVGVGTPVFVEP